MGLFLFTVLFIIVLIILISCIKIVPQAKAYVVELELSRKV